MGIERISSLHEDIMVPKATEHLGEYKDYPERFDPKEKSVLTRLEQFGVDLVATEDVLGKKINELTWDEYTDIISEAIKVRYDVIVASVFDKFMFPTPENPSEQERVEKMFELFKHFESMDANPGIILIKRKDNIKEEQTNIVLGLEAGAHLIKSVSDASMLVDKGVKLFGLQYGKDTPLALNTEGLTQTGISVVNYLFDQDLIIDLAHSSFKTRQDVITLAKNKNKGHLVSYTHGCTEEDIMDSWKGKLGERALKKEEAGQIIGMGGIIGLGVTLPFFENTKKVAERINAIAGEGGINNIAIGSDFGGVGPAGLTEIKNPDDFVILANILADDYNMSDENIDKVIRTNAKEWIRKAIK